MTDWALPRMIFGAGRRDLTFRGLMLGSATSFRHGALRWFEVSIYRTDRGRYVVAGNGKTIVPGENDRPWAATLDTVDEVIQRLLRTDREGERYLTKTAREALSQAARADEAFLQALVAWGM